jgi:hypothetical protein
MTGAPLWGWFALIVVRLLVMSADAWMLFADRRGARP